MILEYFDRSILQPCQDKCIHENIGVFSCSSLGNSAVELAFSTHAESLIVHAFVFPPVRYGKVGLLDLFVGAQLNILGRQMRLMQVCSDYQRKYRTRHYS